MKNRVKTLNFCIKYLFCLRKIKLSVVFIVLILLCGAVLVIQDRQSQTVSAQNIMGQTPDRLSHSITPQTCAPVPEGIISWWKAENNANDVLGNNNGMLENNVTFSKGIVGQSFSTSNSNYVSVPDSPSLNPTQELTLSGWFKFDSVPNISALIAKPLRNSINDSYVLYFQGGKLRGVIGDKVTSPNPVPSNFTPTTGVWYHIAYTFNNAEDAHKLYVDGVEVGSATTTDEPEYETNPHPLLIGAELENNNLAFFHDGQIDEVQIYNRALSESELRAIFEAGADGVCTSTCTYALDTTNLNISENGGNGSFNVTTTPLTECPWTAVSNADWITTTSSGNGAGTINFSVAANIGITRTGTITVGNRIFTIVQNGNGVGVCAPIPSGIVSWWKAEGNANDTLDIHNGILQSGASFRQGKVGQAFDLTGSNDFVDLGDWFNLPEHSITMWVNAGSTQLRFADILDNNHSTGINWVLQQDNRNTNRYFFGDNAAVAFNLTADTWHYFAATRTNDTLRVYLDGVLQGERTGLNPINYNGQQFFRIGKFGNPGFNRNWNGLVDELDVYNRALTETEVQRIYNAGSAGKCVPSAIQSLTFTTNSVEGGQTTEGTVILRNSAPPEGSVINLSSDNSSIVSVPSSITIAGGEISGTFTVSTSIPEQDETVTITAEYQGERTSSSISVNSPKPDLEIATVNIPAEVQTDSAFNVSWTTKNIGTATTNSSWREKLYLSEDNQIGTGDILLGEFPFSDSLDPEQIAQRIQAISIPRNAISQNGQYYLLVQTDSNDEVIEINENNNVNSTIIDVTRTPRPDLIVENITAPNTAFFDQTILVQWTIKNIGDGPTNASNWNDFVYISSDDIPEIEDPFKVAVGNVSYLQSGESYTATTEIKIPRGLVGLHKIVVWTDGDGTNHRSNNFPHQVTEDDEENNFGFALPIQLNAPLLPDLQAEQVIAPESAFAGGQISLNWQVKNLGNGVTPQDQIEWTDKIYLSEDTTLEINTDRLIGSRGRSGSLAQKQGYTVNNYMVSIPNDIAGDWYVFVVADGDNQVYEFNNENNNSEYDRDKPGSPLNITATPPDLIVSGDISANPNVQTGENITVSWTIKNQGAFDATPAWFDGVYLSEDQTLDKETDILLKSNFRNGILGPGLTYNASADVTIPSCIEGEYYLFVSTDSRNQIFEYDPKIDAENNNTSSPKEIAITNATPDLRVTTIANPTNGTAGQQIAVGWTVGNQGIGSTIQANWVDRIYLSPNPEFVEANSTLIGSYEHTGILASGENYSRTENVSIPNSAQGNYYVVVITDASGTVEECSNNENNRSIGNSQISIDNNLPDFVVQSAGVQSNFVGGQNVNISWSVENIGNAAAGNSQWGDAIYFSTDAILSNDDRRLTTTSINGSLAVNETYNRQLPVKLPVVAPGSYYLIVQTDYLNNVFEGQFENNNGRETVIAIEVPEIDLSVSSLNVPNTAYSGQRMNVSWSVTNNGSLPTVGSEWIDEIVLSLDQIDDPSDRVIGFKQHTNGLNGGESYSESAEVFIPQGLTGQYYLFVRTDSRNNIAESNEKNNNALKGIAIELTPPADFTVTKISIPASGSPGESITFNWTVQNIGSNSATGIWSDAVYLSQDQTWDINDILIGKKSQVGPINIGESYNSNLSISLPGINPGDYYIIIRSDVRNHVREDNENNNTASSNSQTVIDLTELEIGVPKITTLTTGQERFYKTTAPANETLRFTLDGQFESANEFFAKFGEIATRNSFDFSFDRPNEADQEIIVPNTQVGNYFTTIRSQISVPESQDITVKAEIIPFEITSVSPNRVGDNGQVTLTLKGGKFEEGATVKLIGNGSTLNAQSVIKVDSSTIKARFLFENAPRGTYGVFLTNSGGEETSLPSAIIIEQSQPAQPIIISNGNLRTRPGRPVSFYNEVKNLGNVDIQYVSVRIQVFRPNNNSPVTIINYRPEDSLPRKSDFPNVDWNNDPITNSYLRNLSTDTFLYRDLSPGESFSFNTEIQGATVDEAFIRSQTVGLNREEMIAALRESTEAIRQEILARGINVPNTETEQSFWDVMQDLYATYNYIELIDGVIEDRPSSFRSALVSSFRGVRNFFLTDIAVNGCTLFVSGIPNCSLRCLAKAGCANIQTAADVSAAIAAFSFGGPIFGTALALPPAVSAAQNAANSVKDAGNCLDRCPQPAQPECMLSASTSSDEFIRICPQNAIDPNEKLSPDGFGEQRFVSNLEEIPYTINFENLPTATAYAQKIKITDQLDSNLDWRTFRLKEIGFKQYSIQVPENRAFYQERMQLGEDLGNLLADISAGIDISNGTVTWTLTAIDSATGEQPNGVNQGLLPPNNDDRDGEGYVVFTIRPKSSSPTGTVITNKATITFDTEAPIITNVVSNTLDSDAPTSSVNPLSSTQDTSDIELSWSGQDLPDGSGLKSFDVYVSEDGEPFELFKQRVTDTSGIFKGKYGKTYRFYSVARDNTGNLEAKPETPDAEVIIRGGDTEGDVSPRPEGNDGRVSVSDITQIRRFVAGLDSIFQYNEFQRADTAPLTEKGNGVLSTADIVQVRRFAAGLDPTTTADGPNDNLSINLEPFKSKKETLSLGLIREVRPIRVNRIGDQLTIAIEIDAQGNEVGIGFTLNFDSSVLSNPSNVTLGTGASGASLTVNNAQSNQGKFGIILDKDPNNPFPAGTQQLVTVTFDIAPQSPQTTNISFGETPIFREVVDGNAQKLSATFSPADVQLVTPTGARVSVKGRVTDSNGQGIYGAIVSMTDMQGNIQTSRTNPFGHFTFTGAEVGQSYIFNTRHKLYRFDSQIIFLQHEVSDLWIKPIVKGKK